jgi:hypothetical protein
MQTHFSNCLHLYERDVRVVEQIVASNERRAISRIDAGYQNWDFAPALIANSEVITNLDFGLVREPELRRLLTGFFELRQKGDSESFLKSLKVDILSHLGYNWAKKVSKFSLSHSELETTMRKMRMKSESIPFASLRYASVDEIVTEVERYSEQLEPRFENLIEVLIDEDDWLTVNLNRWSKKSIVQMVLLSVLDYSIDPYIANASPGMKCREHIDAARDRLGLRFVATQRVARNLEQLLDLINDLDHN